MSKTFFIFRVIRGIFFFFAFLVLIIFYLWSISAIYFLDFPWHWLKPASSWFFALGTPLAFIFFRKKKKYVFLSVLAVCLLLSAVYYTMEETNNKNWITSHAVLPSISFSGDKITIKNVRNFDYKTENDFTVMYYDKTFDLNTIDSLDYILSYWDGNKNIAHSLLSFGFGKDSYLCVSVETRLEKGQTQTGLKGLYNQYGLIYILGDESDILMLRTNFRKEDVYLYRLKVKKEEIRKLFLAIMHRVDSLKNHPQFYNSVKHNCLTSLLADIETAINQKLKFDYRYIFNGRSDEMIYERGKFQTNGLSFIEFKKMHYVNQYMTKNNAPTDYSKKIRKYGCLKEIKNEDI